MDRWARAQNPLPHPYTHARPLKCACASDLKGKAFAFLVGLSAFVYEFAHPPPPLRPQINLLKVQISPLKPYISFLMHQISLLSPQNSPLKPQRVRTLYSAGLVSIRALSKVKFVCPRLKRDK